MTGVAITVDSSDPAPPYEQVRRQIAAHIASGALQLGERLAPVRQLAGDLGVAPGTVARAYRELEQAGLLTTARRAGTVVARRSPTEVTSVRPDVREAARVFAAACRAEGMPLPQAVALVEQAWSH